MVLKTNLNTDFNRHKEPQHIVQKLKNHQVILNLVLPNIALCFSLYYIMSSLYSHKHDAVLSPTQYLCFLFISKYSFKNLYRTTLVVSSRFYLILDKQDNMTIFKDFKFSICTRICHGNRVYLRSFQFQLSCVFFLCHPRKCVTNDQVC